MTRKFYMENKNLFLSVKETAEILEISRPTLITYEKRGFIKPDYVDSINGRKYYLKENVTRFMEEM